MAKQTKISARFRNGLVVETTYDTGELRAALRKFEEDFGHLGGMAAGVSVAATVLPAKGASVCPQCGGAVELVTPADGGAIEEQVVTRHMELARMVRPATFTACTRCEWCAEGRH